MPPFCRGCGCKVHQGSRTARPDWCRVFCVLDGPSFAHANHQCGDGACVACVSSPNTRTTLCLLVLKHVLVCCDCGLDTQSLMSATKATLTNACCWISSWLTIIMVWLTIIMVWLTIIVAWLTIIMVWLTTIVAWLTIIMVWLTIIMVWLTIIMVWLTIIMVWLTIIVAWLTIIMVWLTIIVAWLTIIMVWQWCLCPPPSAAAAAAATAAADEAVQYFPSHLGSSHAVHQHDSHLDWSHCTFSAS